MKILSLVRIFALSACLVLPSLAFAQAPDDTIDGGGRGRGHHKHMANLTPAGREELKAAHQKAKHDPAYQAAKAQMRQARQAMKAALLKADPNLQPILDKMPEGHGRRG